MSNQIRSRDGQPFDFEDGLKIRNKLLTGLEGATEIGCKQTPDDLTPTILQEFLYTLKQYIDSPTAPDLATSNDSTKAANTRFVQALLNTLKDGVTADLNTLKKLAAAINNDKDYHDTVTTALATKLATIDFQKATAILAEGGANANAITASFTPTITVLTHGMVLHIRATGANTITNPTFTPNNGNIAFKTIVKGHDLPLATGDISGSGYWMELRFDEGLDKWVLLNPATGVTSGLPEIENYAALRAYNGPLVAFYVRCEAERFDGGAGVYRVDSADTTSSDNGRSVLVDTVGRRWKKDFVGVSVADLANTTDPEKGAGMVGYDADTVKQALDTRLPEIENYDTLRAYTGPRTDFYVQGHTDKLDGGAGIFRVDPNDTTSIDNGGTILVDASGRRWKREFSGAVNALWFGAKTNIRTALLAAHSALPISGGEIVVPPGDYPTADSISFVGKSNITLNVLAGATIRLTQASTHGHLIGFVQGSVYGGIDGAIIENCKVYGGGVLKTPTALTTENVVAFERVKNAFCIGMNIPEAGRKAITTQVNDAAGVLKNGNITIRDNRIGTTVNNAISIEQGHDGLVLITGNTIESAGLNAINISGTLSPATSVTRVICDDNYVRAAGQHGFYFYKILDLSFGSNNICDTVTQRGLNADACGNVRIIGGTFLQSGRESARLTNNSGLLILSNTICQNASNGASGTYNAIYFEGNVRRPRVEKVIILGNTHAVAVQSAQAYEIFESDIVTGTLGVFGGTQPRVFSTLVGGVLYGLDISERRAFSDGDSTPSVAHGRLFSTSNTTATTITAFDEGTEGQEITVIFNDSNTTIADGVDIKLAGSINFTGTVGNDSITFIRTFGAWLEKCRSDN